MPTTFWIHIHNFLQPMFVFWWMPCTVLLAFELKLGLAWDMPILLFCRTWVTFELSGLALASPDQTGSSGFSLTLPVVRTEGQQKPSVHLSPSHALRLPVQARLRAALPGWPVLQSCRCVTLLISYSRARIDSTYMWLFCAAVYLKSYPGFH